MGFCAITRNNAGNGYVTAYGHLALAHRFELAQTAPGPARG